MLQTPPDRAALTRFRGDIGAITAACLLHEVAVRQGLPVIEVLVFAGERNVAAPWLNDQKKVSVRESEFRLECNVLGAEAVCWNLDAYRTSGYQPSQLTPQRADLRTAALVQSLAL